MSDTTPTVAPLWRRFAAMAYDSLIILALSFCYGALATAISAAVFDQQSADFQPMFTGTWFFLGWVGSIAYFYCWFWHRSGQTLGMKTWRIKVVPKQHPQATPTWSQSIRRAAVGAPSLLLLGAGYWYKWANLDGDCLHDILSNTRVVVQEKPKV